MLIKFFKFDQLNRIQKGLVLSGLFLQGLSLILFIGVLIGFFNFEDFDLFGHSGIRTIAAIAVMGCLSAAIGLNDINEE
jgi:hypothetical protein